VTIKYPKRLELARTPTPIEYLGRLSERYGGPEIYMKRDDLTGAALTGNKVRKLEFLVAEAMQQQAEVLITCGGVQSNHARATAIAATKMGLKSHLVLRTSGTSSLDGNLFLDRMVDAEIQFISDAEYENVDAVMQEAAQRYQEQGVRAYVIPEGGSTELGALGYVRAMQEITGQLAAQKLHIDVMICAVGSGGTLAGLMLGKHAFGADMEVWGINVCDDAAYFRKRTRDILRAALRRFDIPLNLADMDIKVIDGYVGKGYALNRQEEIDTIKEVACTEGVILDPVYTGKAMYGMKDLITKGKLKKAQKVLFLHSGGIFGLLPKRNLFF